MADAANIAQAKKVYGTLCSMLKNKGWNFDSDDAKLKIRCKARGDDLPMELSFSVDAERDIVQIISLLPCNAPDDKRIDTAIAVCEINNMLVHGCFDFNVLEGYIFFRMASSYKGGDLSEEALYYILMCACTTVDEYNDKLLMLTKGMVDLEKFIESIKN